MRTTLHLHVGMPKCGSSSLQGFLLHHQDELAARGFAYPIPSGGPKANLKAYLIAASGGPGDPVFRYQNPGVRLETGMADLWAAVEAAQAPNVILSGEAAYKYRDGAIIDDITGRFDTTRVHIVLRPKVEWVMSHYAQGVKTGRYDMTIEEFLASAHFRTEVLPRVSFAQHVAFWQNRFGAENLSLHFAGRRFPSVVTQFLEAVDLGLTEPQSTARRNQSPSAFQLSAVIAANTGRQEDLLKVKKTVLWTAERRDPQPAAGFLTAQVEAIMAPIFAPDTEALMKLQDRITAEDLHPDNSAKHAQAVSFEEVVSSRAFARLMRRLERKDIPLTNLRGVTPAAEGRATRLVRRLRKAARAR